MCLWVCQKRFRMSRAARESKRYNPTRRRVAHVCWLFICVHMWMWVCAYVFIYNLNSRPDNTGHLVIIDSPAIVFTSDLNRTQHTHWPTIWNPTKGLSLSQTVCVSVCVCASNFRLRAVEHVVCAINRGGAAVGRLTKCRVPRGKTISGKHTHTRAIATNKVSCSVYVLSTHILIVSRLGRSHVCALIKMPT